MKRTILILISLCVSWLPLQAQVGGEVEVLRKELQAMKEAFEKAQAESRRQIEELTRRLDSVTRAPSNAPPQRAATNQPSQTPEQKKLADELAAELGGVKGATNPPTQSLGTPTKPW